MNKRILDGNSFAKDLEKVLLEYSCLSSFSIELYEEWEGVKTSLLNMNIEKIENKNSHAIILRFKTTYRRILPTICIVMSYCISYGIVIGRMVSIVWETDHNTFSKFIEAKSCISMNARIFQFKGILNTSREF